LRLPTREFEIPKGKFALGVLPLLAIDLYTLPKVNLYFDLQGAFMLIITNVKIRLGGFEIIEKLVMVTK
jgi:hypothetical protein